MKRANIYNSSNNITVPYLKTKPNKYLTKSRNSGI